MEPAGYKLIFIEALFPNEMRKTEENDLRLSFHLLVEAENPNYLTSSFGVRWNGAQLILVVVRHIKLLFTLLLGIHCKLNLHHVG